MKHHIESLEGRRLLSSPGTVQTIDSSGDVGQYTSVALQPSSQLPAIAYYDVTNHELKFAFEDSVGWHTQRVDGGGSDHAGEFASLAFDSSGKAWIAYYDATNKDLKIAHGDGTNGFTIQTVESIGNQGMYASLALTKAGLPRISYEGTVGSNGGGGVKFASFDGTHWTITNIHVDTDPNSFDTELDDQQTSLALDGKDRPRVSFTTQTNGDGQFELDYASFDGHRFNVETVESFALSDTGLGSHLVLDNAGHPHISYVAPFEMGGGGDVSVATKPADTWIFTRVDEPVGGEVSGLDDDRTSIALDSAGNSYVAYQGIGLALSFEASGGSTYAAKLLDGIGSSGKYVSMALDGATNTLEIAYYDGLNKNLKLYTGSVTAPGAVPKEFEGNYNAMQLAADGTLNLAFFNNDTFFGAQGLQFITRSSAGVWSSQTTIDATPGNGQYVSMALDATGSPVIAYFDSKNADLKYASMSKGKWKLQDIDSKGSVGQYTSIAFDSAGDPAISYYDKSSGDLRLATLVKGKWSIQTVDSTGDVGRFSQLALDPLTGRFDIAYERTSTGATVFAENQPNGSWTMTTVDTTKQGGGYISLEFDHSGEPAFSYYDAFNADLKFAHRIAGAWQTATVVSKKAQGLYTKLFFSGKKHTPTILYYNKSANELDQATGDIGSTWTFTGLRANSGRNTSYASNGAGERFLLSGSAEDDLLVEQLLS